MNFISFLIIDWRFPSFWIYVLSFNQIQMVVIHTHKAYCMGTSCILIQIQLWPEMLLYSWIVWWFARISLSVYCVCASLLSYSLQSINKTGSWPESKKKKLDLPSLRCWLTCKLNWLTFQWQFISYHVVSQENMINMFWPWICHVLFYQFIFQVDPSYCRWFRNPAHHRLDVIRPW